MNLIHLGTLDEHGSGVAKKPLTRRSLREVIRQWIHAGMRLGITITIFKVVRSRPTSTREAEQGSPHSGTREYLVVRKLRAAGEQSRQWVYQWSVNGRLTAAPEDATWRLYECTAAGRAAAQVGARALPDAPPSRRGWIGVVDSDAEYRAVRSIASGFRTSFSD